MKKDIYEKIWKEEYLAHKITIEKNMELRGSVDRLVQINANLIKKMEELSKEFKVYYNEIIRLKTLNESLEQKLLEKVKEESNDER